MNAIGIFNFDNLDPKNQVHGAKNVVHHWIKTRSGDKLLILLLVFIQENGLMGFKINSAGVVKVDVL